MLRALHPALLGLVVVLATAASAARAPHPSAQPRTFAGRMRGVCWEAGREIAPQQLDPVVATGADWIAQTPFGWVRSPDVPEIELATDGVLWGESDSGLVATARWARARGVRTLLKPHLWVRGEWSGHIAMQSEQDWRRWFDAYERWILHYARLAEATHMDALAVGSELGLATRRTADWRRVIGRVRQVYKGRLTYCANWYDEAERIQFWDALDFVGVQAYYPLAASARPPADSIRAAWDGVAARLAALARRTGRRVVLTEVGYRSVAGALREPWSWDERGSQDLVLQRDAYAAMFGAVWNRPWCGGVFIWKWHARLTQGWGMHPNGFTPQGKPALDVVRAWFGAAAAR
jgi:glycosyl hydrolase family 113